MDARMDGQTFPIISRFIQGQHFKLSRVNISSCLLTLVPIGQILQFDQQERASINKKKNLRVKASNGLPE